MAPDWKLLYLYGGDSPWNSSLWTDSDDRKRRHTPFGSHRDEILPLRDDGRDQSTTSWEYDFVCDSGDVHVLWDELMPTYRGKPKPGAKPLDRSSIKRISFMMRSFFGEQEGDFRLTIAHVAAVGNRPTSSGSDSSVEKDMSYPQTTSASAPSPVAQCSWLDWIYGWAR
ncbi:Uncharacterized protein Cob_v002176 [Colletotrichum orbiculare MAFF 240422]|uniref:NADH:ubiquinone oxidoreductase intermediate-associated protein 30 domain-containing protein n=1 Tax=Colletotrichum orbiculare (strain 104-T / ATCC 96160 / CBS 514.97 / LARS 414 / MAFF 240422) TaxID=1213857 RepID=A0A484G3C3_COLOR|nr:Uncharacterized protein Cob_v002176 [Colletotrichum orbiculare MAFF 240422]